MAKTKKQVAVGLASLHGGKTVVSVYSSMEDDLDTEIVPQPHECKKCGTVAGYTLASPFCITCGSEDLEEPTEDRDVEQFEDSDEDTLASIHCPKCTASNILTKSSAKVLAGKMHCTVCSAELDFTNEVDELEDETVSNTDTEDTFDPTATEELENSETAKKKCATEEEEELDPVEDDVTASDDEEDELVQDINVFDEVVDSNTAIDELDIAEGEDELVASYKGIPVAVLTSANAGSNKEVMFKPTFASAIKSTAKQLGIKKALAELGFKHVVIKARLNKVVSKLADKRSETVTSSYEEKTASLQTQYKHALSIASVGLNKGFWKGKSNPLKASCYNVLTSAGVKNAAKMVDSIFASVGEEYTEVLLDTTEELLDKSPELLDELAKTLSDSTYQNIPDTEDEEDEEDTGVEANLKGKNLVTSSTKVNNSSEVTSSIVPRPGMFLKS